MAQTMTPSFKPMTAGQIDKAVATYRALLEKHAPTFDSGAVQQVLGQTELASEQLSVFRKRVESLSNLIVRRVRVNRSRTPQEMLDATGRKQYTNKGVVNAIPAGEGDEVEVIFFNLGRDVSDEELENEFHLRGLKPVDVYVLAAVNEADPSFADDLPNCTHWKDAQDKWCFAAFDRLDGERFVRVYRCVSVWGGYWWFAGVRK